MFQIIVASIFISLLVGIKFKKRKTKLQKLLNETKKYANINEELYMEFLRNLNMSREFYGHSDISNQFLRKALSSFYDISNDFPDIQDDISEIADNILEEMYLKEKDL